MRLVVQRVLESSVKVDGREVGRVGKGFMVLCGVEDGDTQDDVRYCVDKTVNLRIFEDFGDFAVYAARRCSPRASPELHPCGASGACGADV